MATLFLWIMAGAALAAETVAPGVVTGQAAGTGLPGVAWMQNIGLGVAALALLGAALRWLSTGGVDLLVAWETRRLLALINRPIEDPDVAHFWRTVFLEGIVLAERKMPDSGCGPQRKAWLIELFFRAAPFLRSAANERMIGDGIDRWVRENDQMLKDLAAKIRAENAAKIAPPPAETSAQDPGAAP